MVGRKAKRMKKERNMRIDGWRGQGNENGGVERIKAGNKQLEDMRVEDVEERETNEMRNGNEG